jgi:hypothetical protein
MGVKATRVDDLFDEAGRAPGAFKFFAADGERAGFNFRCPRGACDHMGSVRFAPPASNGWTWDGDAEAPTIEPSVLLKVGDGQGGLREHWHGWLRAGVWESC